MRTDPKRDRAITGIILATLVVAAFVIIACSNTEEVTAPVATETGAVNGAGLAAEDGKAVFFGDDGSKLVLEMADGDSWTAEELHEHLDAARNDPAVAEKLKQHAQQLHEEGNLSFGEDGPHRIFVDTDTGERVLVEFEGNWVSKEELHEELQNKVKPAEKD